MNITIQNATRSTVSNLTQKLIGALTVCALFVIPVLSPGAAKAALVTALPDVSALIPYALFGNADFLNLATVKGNVGISANGTFSMSAPSVITGRLDLGSGVNISGIANGASIGGFIYPDATAIHQNVPLATAQSQVFSASTTLQGLAANYVLGALTTAQSFSAVGSGAVTVIDIASISGAGDITLVGGASDYFVINVAGAASFTGSTGIQGVDGSHILINLYNSSIGDLGVVAHINNLLNGTILVPYDSATFHSENGAIWGGNGLITLMSGATIDNVPFAPPVLPVPEPTTFIAGALLLLPFGASTLRILRRKATA
jgi:hypothetical protein